MSSTGFDMKHNQGFRYELYYLEKKFILSILTMRGDSSLKNRNQRKKQFIHRIENPGCVRYQGLSSQKFLSYHDDMVTWYDVAVRIQTIKKFWSSRWLTIAVFKLKFLNIYSELKFTFKKRDLIYLCIEDRPAKYF